METLQVDEPTVSLVPSPAKRKKYTTNFDQCIICQTNTDECLRKPRDSSLKILKSAMELRHNEAYQRLKPHLHQLSDLNVQWHSTCYESCTSKHNLCLVIRRQSPATSQVDADDASVSGYSQSSIVSRSQITGTDWSKCLFCKNKTHKRIKELVNASTFEAGNAIYRAADQKGDEEMLYTLHGVNKDLVAAEAKYHKACYSSYVSKTNLQFTGFKEGSLESTYASAFKYLSAQITTEVLAGKAFNLDVLLRMYKKRLEQNGVDSQLYTRQKLKLRLNKHFGEGIVWHQPYDRSQAEFLYSSSISVHDVLNAAHKKASKTNTERSIYQPEEAANQHRDERKRLLHLTATMIRADIDASKGVSIKPPDVTKLTLATSKSLIPNSLYWLLRLIVANRESEDDEDSAQCRNEADERRIIMLAQDVVHCASHGRIKMPKHVSLAMLVRHLTGSKQLVTMLNRMGHCVSYDEVQVIDTSLAKDILATSEQTGVVVPSNICPGSFVQVAADNNDINEETLNGMNTTHATTLVVYQRGNFGPIPQQTVHADHTKRQRSFQSRGCCQAFLNFSSSGRRPTTRKYEGKILDEWLFPRDQQQSYPAQMDLAWALVRLCPTTLFKVEITPPSPSAQITPSWSGFNAIVHTSTPDLTKVGFCPLLQGSPTEYSTVYTVMKNVEAMMSSLGQKDSVITFDLAIYVKAKEIQWRRPEEFESFVIRLGGFHIALNYLSLMGKKYSGSGLEDLLIESGVYGSSTASLLLQGKSYNRGVRAHKLIMEAFFRRQWAEFAKWLLTDESNVYDKQALAECITACREALEAGGNVMEMFERLMVKIPEIEVKFTS